MSLKIRCSRCMDGPYDISVINEILFEFGDDRHPIRYCKACAKQLRLSVPPPKVSSFFAAPLNKTKPVDKKEDDVIDIHGNQLIKSENIPKIVNGNHAVFIVKCLDNTLFCGITKDLDKSIKYMNTGSGNKYTRPKTRRPVKLVYVNQVENMKSANVKRNELKKKLSI